MCLKFDLEFSKANKSAEREPGPQLKIVCQLENWISEVFRCLGKLNALCLSPYVLDWELFGGIKIVFQPCKLPECETFVFHDSQRLS